MRSCWIACLIAACSPSSSDDFEQGDGHDQLAPPLEGQETQGQRLLGDRIDDFGTDPAYHVAALVDVPGRDASGREVMVAFAGNAALQAGSHVGVDPALDGVVLQTTTGGELELTVSRGGSDLAFYKLRYRATPTDAFEDPCQGGDAVPLAGRWTRSGLHEADARYVSFACTGAVAYKCTVWGYLAGGDPASLRWRSQQACTRMARADYCADGTTHTRDGTRITIYDRVGVNAPPPPSFPGVDRWPPDPRSFYFEAMWNDGATPASCLGRVRWQSMPLGGVCGTNSELRDPRLDATLRFCDDVEVSTAEGPLLLNTSHYDDLRLHVWTLGDDRVSTVRGYYDESATTPDRAPFPLAGDYTHLADDAMLLRVIPEGLDPALFEEIHVYSQGTDLTLAGVSSPPPGYTDLGFEGYAAKTKRTPDHLAFNLYRNPTTGDLIATTNVPPGYDLVSTIGFLLPGDASTAMARTR